MKLLVLVCCDFSSFDNHVFESEFILPYLILLLVAEDVYGRVDETLVVSYRGLQFWCLLIGSHLPPDLHESTHHQQHGRQA